VSIQQKATWVVLRELPLAVSAAEPQAELRGVAERKLGLRRGEVQELRVVQRALDARHRPPRHVYAVELALEPVLATRLTRARRVEPAKRLSYTRLRLPRPPDGPRPVVVGAGPAGLFAALTLAEAGWPPILLERGKAVEERARDVSRLYREGVLDADSNVCYGEGGAGTFSDGKLYTRVGDARVRLVMEALVARGADPDILVDNRPHLGTDRLVELMRSFRAHLAGLGVELRFGEALADVEVEDGVLAAFRLRSGARLEARAAVLATGHSAREVWERLQAAGLPLEARPFAVGFRVEHPQGLIDEIRYGRGTAHEGLPAADYRLTYNEEAGDRRGVYSFCMCPGGVVVTTPTRPEELCINGMSHASRAGRYANSALVVTVGLPDFAPHASRGVFAGAAFQEAAERAAYLAGGGAYVAPAARLTDFAAGRVSQDLPATSYRRGLAPADLGTLYPSEVVAALRRALGDFDRKMRGFLTSEAKLIGVETRTASPIRVPRGDDLQALGARGLFPAGEGMGYGGGIVSAAVDGMRAAEALLSSVGAEPQTVDLS
jgi:uncharacterized FAD-dependent dehydrogenase